MPQEFQVVRCYACLVFQVQQVKKVPRWVCKMCGEKQSLKKEYGRGSGADCRQHVQKLNMVAGESLDLGHGQQDSFPEQGHYFTTSGRDDDHQAVAERRQDSFSEDLKAENCHSRWQAYIDGDDCDQAPRSPSGEDSSHPHLGNVEITLSRPLCRGRGGRKYGGWKGGRKRKRDDLDQDNAESWEDAAAPAFHQNSRTSASDLKTSGFPRQDAFPDFRSPAENPSEIARKVTNPDGTDSAPTAKSGVAPGTRGLKPSWNGQADDGDSGKVLKKQRAAETSRFASSKWGQFLQGAEDESDNDQEGEEDPRDIRGRVTEASIVSPVWVRGQRQLKVGLSSLSHVDTACSSKAAFLNDSDPTVMSPNKPVWIHKTSSQDCKLVGLNTLGREESVKNSESRSCLQRGFEENVFSVDDESLLDEIFQDDW